MSIHSGVSRWPASMRSAGFSLIELLVVVSIVVILSSLGIAAARVVLDQARSMRCASNVRQILLSIEAYAQDWSGLLVSHDVGGVVWWANLAPYVDAQTTATNQLDTTKKGNVFMSCPVWNSGRSKTVKCGYGMPTTNNVGAANPFCNEWSDAMFRPVRDGMLAELTYPSRRIILGESCDGHLQGGGNPAVWDGWAVCGTNQALWEASVYRSHPNRHKGMANYGFVDGRVAALPPLGSAWGYCNPTKLNP